MDDDTSYCPPTNERTTTMMYENLPNQIDTPTRYESLKMRQKGITEADEKNAKETFKKLKNKRKNRRKKK